MSDLIYYSTNTLLAYLINEYYYKGRHFVYCTPYYAQNPDPLYPQPTSSNPKILYERFKEESKVSDKNARTINANKIGLKKGVEERLKNGIITAEIRVEIIELIEGAENSQFEPLLYLIPAEGVKGLITKVPYKDKANPFFDEYSGDITKDSFEKMKY